MEINLNEIRNEILELNELSDEELLLKLIPQEERHSPNANLERAKTFSTNAYQERRQTLSRLTANTNIRSTSVLISHCI